MFPSPTSFNTTLRLMVHIYGNSVHKPVPRPNQVTTSNSRLATSLDADPRATYTLSGFSTSPQILRTTPKSKVYSTPSPTYVSNYQSLIESAPLLVKLGSTNNSMQKVSKVSLFLETMVCSLSLARCPVLFLGEQRVGSFATWDMISSRISTVQD